MRQGAALKLLLRTIGETAERASTHPALQAYAKQLAEAIETVASTTRRVMERVATPEAYLANASAYLDMLGHVVIAWIWLEQALAADEATASGDSDRAFYAGKRQAAQYFFHRELPQIAQWARIVADGEASALEMQDAWF